MGRKVSKSTKKFRKKDATQRNRGRKGPKRGRSGSSRPHRERDSNRPSHRGPRQQQTGQGARSLEQLEQLTGEVFDEPSVGKGARSADQPSLVPEEQIFDSSDEASEGELARMEAALRGDDSEEASSDSGSQSSDDDQSASSSSSSGSAEKKQRAPAVSTRSVASGTFTRTKLKGLSRALARPSVSMRWLRLGVRVFKSACRMFQLKAANAKQRADIDDSQRSSAGLITMADAGTRDAVLRWGLRDLPAAVRQIAARRSDGSGKEAEQKTDAPMAALVDSSKVFRLRSSQKFKALGMVLKAYLNEVNYLLLCHTQAEETMLRALLCWVEPAIPLFAASTVHSSRVLRTLCGIWSTRARNVAIDAFLRLRQLVLYMPSEMEMLDKALKYVYLSYVRVAGECSELTLPTLVFLSNCVVELYGSLDQVKGYQKAFVYIRQLAIQLRTALMTKSKVTYKSVYNWQFINALRVWVGLVTSWGRQKTHVFNALVYPVVQLCLGVAWLYPHFRFVPLRLQCVRLLNEVSRKCAVYVPVLPLLLDVFERKEFNMPASEPSAGKGGMPEKQPVMVTQLKVSEGMMRSRAYQRAATNEIFKMLWQHLAYLSHSVGFPEMSVPVRRALRALRRRATLSYIRKACNELLHVLDASDKWVLEQRGALGINVHQLLQMGASVLFTFLPEGLEDHQLTSGDASQPQVGRKRGRSGRSTGPAEQKDDGAERQQGPDLSQASPLYRRAAALRFIGLNVDVQPVAPVEQSASRRRGKDKRRRVERPSTSAETAQTPAAASSSDEGQNGAHGMLEAADAADSDLSSDDMADDQVAPFTM